MKTNGDIFFTSAEWAAQSIRGQKQASRSLQAGMKLNEPLNFDIISSIIVMQHGMLAIRPSVKPQLGQSFSPWNVTLFLASSPCFRPKSAIRQTTVRSPVRPKIIFANAPKGFATAIKKRNTKIPKNSVSTHFSSAVSIAFCLLYFSILILPIKIV